MSKNLSMQKNELTYKDFKIGQKIVCVQVDDFVEDQHLTIGKTYKIEDLDFHFPNSICVRSDNKRVSMFFNIAYFSNVKTLRKLKLQKIQKNAESGI